MNNNDQLVVLVTYQPWLNDNFSMVRTYSDKIQKNVEEMKCDMKNICQSLQDVDGKLNDIANNTKITAWASSVIATQVPDWKREAQDRANKTYI